VLRRFCVPGSLDSADSFTQASGEQFLRVALCSVASEKPCAKVRKGNFGVNYELRRSNCPIPKNAFLLRLENCLVVCFP
jgi:hypothetical protein